MVKPRYPIFSDYTERHLRAEVTALKAELAAQRGRYDELLERHEALEETLALETIEGASFKTVGDFPCGRRAALACFDSLCPKICLAPHSFEREAEDGP